MRGQSKEKARTKCGISADTHTMVHTYSHSICACSILGHLSSALVTDLVNSAHVRLCTYKAHPPHETACPRDQTLGIACPIFLHEINLNFLVKRVSVVFAFAPLTCTETNLQYMRCFLLFVRSPNAFHCYWPCKCRCMQVYLR